MLTYVARIPLSTRTLVYLSDLLRARRNQIGSRWRRLDPSRQALLVLAQLRNGDTYSRLTTGFGIGVATVYRYVREAIDLLAEQVPSLSQVIAGCGQLWYLILDGTLVRIDPGRRGSAVLLGKAQAPRRQRASCRRSARPAAVGLSSSTRIDP